MTDEQFNEIIKLLKEIKDDIPDAYDAGETKSTVDKIEDKADDILKEIEKLSSKIDYLDR